MPFFLPGAEAILGQSWCFGGSLLGSCHSFSLVQRPSLGRVGALGALCWGHAIRSPWCRGHPWAELVLWGLFAVQRGSVIGKLGLRGQESDSATGKLGSQS